MWVRERDEEGEGKREGEEMRGGVCHLDVGGNE